jgi:hypothetical protein
MNMENSMKSCSRLRSLHNGDPGGGKDPFNGIADGDGKIISYTKNSLKAELHQSSLDNKGNLMYDIRVRPDGSYDMTVRKSDGSILAQCNSNDKVPDADYFKEQGDQLLKIAGIDHKEPKLYHDNPSPLGPVIASIKSSSHQYRPS